MFYYLTVHLSLFILDPLSAVDAPTANHIFRSFVAKEGLIQNMTCILVTHSLGLIFYEADHIVILNEGSVLAQGTPQKIARLGGSSVLDGHIDIPNEKNLENSELVQRTYCEDPKVKSGTGEEQIEEEREVGKVKLSTYQFYVSALGGIRFVSIFVVASLITDTLWTSKDWWLGVWSVASEKNLDIGFSETIYYIKVYAILNASSFIFPTLRIAFAYMSSIRASQSTHEKLVQKVLKLSVRFFDTTPMGRIVNRFSGDMQILDMSLIYVATDFVKSLLELVRM